MKELTQEHYAAMDKVAEGVDVYAYGLAVTLREVQSFDSGLIDIVSAKSPPCGEKQQPYFCAVLTEKGVKLVEDNFV